MRDLYELTGLNANALLGRIREVSVMKHKERLDVLLVSLGLAESRAKAQATIMAGEVYVNGQKADKSGMEVDMNLKH